MREVRMTIRHILPNKTTNTTTTVTMGGRTEGPGVGLHTANGPELELARHAPRTSDCTTLNQRTPEPQYILKKRESPISWTPKESQTLPSN